MSSLVEMLLGRRGRGVGNRGQGGGCGWKRGEPGREEAKGGSQWAQVLNREKQKTKPRGWAKGTWKRGPERARGGDRAEECGADSGEKGVRGFRKGRHRPHHPSTHHGSCRASLSPCRLQGRTGRRKRCSCGRHRCPAPRWSRTESNPAAVQPTSEPALSRARRGSWHRYRSRGAGGLMGATHSPRRAPPLHAFASRPRPLSRPRPCHSLRLRPKTAQPPSRPFPRRLFPHCGIIHLCNLPDTAVGCVPISYS